MNEKKDSQSFVVITPGNVEEVVREESTKTHEILEEVFESIRSKKAPTAYFSQEYKVIEELLNTAFRLGEASSASRAQVLKEARDDLKTEAQYIGEDGDMACEATSEKGALIKFRRRVREDVGDDEASEIKIEEIGGGDMALPDFMDCNTEEFSWFVFYREKKYLRQCSLPVYVFRA